MIVRRRLRKALRNARSKNLLTDASLTHAARLNLTVGLDFAVAQANDAVSVFQQSRVMR
jgi:hypothetical protein